MARQAKPSYWESKRGYFCQINGERHPLAYGPKDEPHGPTFLKAMEAFIKLKKPAVPQPPAADLPLCECVQKWLENVQKYKSESYHETSEYVLNATPPKWEPHEVRSWRGRAVSALLPHHVTGWLEGMANWCGTTKRTAWERLVQCLRWCASQKLIGGDPLRGVNAPDAARARPRGQEYAIPDELVKVLIDNAGDAFRDYLVALSRSGARPGEIANAEDYHYDPKLGAFVYRWNAKRGYVWKNARSKKRDRVIYLPPDVISIVEGRLGRQGPGYVFRTPGGGFWEGRRIQDTMQKLRKKKKVRQWLKDHDHDPRHVIAYGLRHRFITNALLRPQCNVKTLADLMGTSVEHVLETYGHSQDELTAMRSIFLSLV